MERERCKVASWMQGWYVCAGLVLLAFVLPAPVLAHEDVEGLVDRVKDSVVNVSSIYYRQPQAVSSQRRSARPEDFFKRFLPPELLPYFRLPEESEGEEEPQQAPPGNSAPRQQEARSEGSGFIISSDGYIVTSFHVVDGADKVVVSFQGRRELEAEVVGLDRATDLALLRVQSRNLSAASLGDSDQLRVGQAVVAIGSPFDLDFSVTAGVISALSRTVASRDTGRYVPFIQSDVAINPGNSGGPLYNMRGQVIGVNAQILSRSGGFMGLSFSVPINVVRMVVAQLRDDGKVARGWLGVSIQDVTSELADSMQLPKPAGALVANVLEDLAAENAGIKAGDVIVEFNGKEILYSRDLPPAVGFVAPGQEVPLVLYRNGEREELRVTVGEMPETEETTAALPSARNDKASANRLGVKARDLKEEEREKLEMQRGILIVSVWREGPAHRAGLRRGDLLLALNGTDLNSVEDFNELQATLPEGQAAWVHVRRGEQYMIVSVRPTD